MSNRPTPPNNPLMNFLSRIWNLITNSRLANFAQIYPFFLPLLVGLFTFIVGLNSSGFFHNLNSQGMNEEFKKEVCRKYEKNVKERLSLEGKNIDSIEKTSFVDNNSDNNFLPFSCEYTLLLDKKERETQKNSIELNPLFPDLINDIDPDEFEKKIDMSTVCNDSKIIEQMIKQAGKDYKPGDLITNKYPKLLPTKKGVYPVFRWVCFYTIKPSKEIVQEKKQRNERNIDLILEEYCDNKTNQAGIKLKKPTHHNYKDPYSLYCVNPDSNT